MGQVVITGPERRRRWADEERSSILSEAFASGIGVADVAVDSTYIRAQRAAFGGKGGARIRQSAARTVGGPRKFTRSPTSSAVPMR